MRYELLRFEHPETLAQTAAARWLSEIPKSAKGSAPYCVALSGGRIARTFFQSITSLVKSGGGSVEGVHFFWGDERCVPPDDPESNFRLSREHLLEPLAVPEPRIHRIRGETEPQAAADEASAELRRVTGTVLPLQPAIDLIFLGLGENGHTASLFPEEPPTVRANPAVYRPVVTPDKPPPHRITLGYPAIAAAPQVWVLASGAGKEQALRDSLAPGAQTPLGQVLEQRAFTRIFTDIQIPRT